ncbi:Pre-mRNA 3'-end-processing factor FIP1 [Pseudolycoriella hygida]|uniref:Pre-mRNA 3'-end-processing factor FIP1 n=1 Tax=Pseudolycoriella hygida TaxID=35572 RepID=A0A9Q0MJP7_9DIPT|nr:Pre-mRNA 3'-end-processing factor FIP1 [Pseudolycoriella hygida]
MADDPNEDSWLYGPNPEQPEEEETKDESIAPSDAIVENDKPEVVEETMNTEADAADEAEEPDEGDGSNFKEETNENGEDSDDSDDYINVVIGDIKSGSSYSIKQRTGTLAPGTAVPADKQKQATGKFSMEEFETVGTIAGVQAHEFSIDSLDEKPWRKPGADITDYFNYGFNEETWRAYCERQKQMRLNESGVGLQSLSANLNNSNAGPNRIVSGINESGGFGQGNFIRRSGGPPPFRKTTGHIDVIGSNVKENVIQVMTAERREYSRLQGMPPPGFPGNEPFFEQETYNYGYEPTQEQQWNQQDPGWIPSGIKELTPGHMVGPPPGMMNVGMMRAPMPGPQMVPPPHMMGPQTQLMPPSHGNDRDRERERERRNDRERERERDRDRGKSEESERGGRDRDRYRERSTRRDNRERSRSRDRRRKSRSRDKDKDRKSRDKKKSHKKDKEKDESD